MADPKTRPFRRGDKVAVHGMTVTSTPGPHRGRVVCADRKSKYFQPLIVLIDDGETELVESFCSDGTRYLTGRHIHLTLGWPKDLVPIPAAKEA